MASYQPVVNMNHPAWIFCHLNVYHAPIVGLLSGKPFEDPKGHKFGMGVQACAADPSLYASKNELLAAYECGHADVATAMRASAAGGGALDADTPLERWRATMPKVGVALPYLMLVHESTHLGQISMWRRVQGMPSACDGIQWFQYSTRCEMTGKAQALETIGELPDDSSLDEVIRELLMVQMIQEGLADHAAGRTLTHGEMKKEVESWLKSSGRSGRKPSLAT